jgi:hypothetical protein
MHGYILIIHGPIHLGGNAQVSSTLYKMVIFFPVPSREVTNQVSLAGNNLIYPGQGEFG